MARDPDLIAFSGVTGTVNRRVVATVDATPGGGNAAVNRINLAIKDAALLAGWLLEATSVDGGGRNQYRMVSQRAPYWADEASPPANYSGRVEMTFGSFDNGSFNQVARDVAHVFAGGPSGGDATQLTTFAGESWIILTPFSGLIMRKNNTGGTGNAAMFGVPNTPTFLQSRGLREVIYCFRCDEFRAGLGPLTGGNKYFIYQDDFVTSETLGVTNPVRPVLSTHLQGDGTGIGATGNVAFANLIDDPDLNDPDTWYPLLCPAKIAWPDVKGVGPVKWRGWIWDIVSRVKRQTSADGIDITPDGHRILWITSNPNNNRAVLGVVVGGVDCPEQ